MWFFVGWLVDWLIGVLWHINRCGLFNSKSCLYIWDLLVNSLLVTLLLNELLELIRLHKVKWFQVFLSNTYNSI